MGNKHCILDFETLGTAIDGLSNQTVVSMAAIVFDEDITIQELMKLSFTEVVNKTFYVKFALSSQKKGERFERTVCTDTLAWWKKQKTEVKKELLPTKNDEHINVAINKFITYLKESECKPKDMKMYSRGQHFDLPILQNLCHTVDIDMHSNIVKYWNYRDLRSCLDELIGSGEFKLPDILENKFIKHDARCDVAHELYMLVFARALAMGEVTTEQLYKSNK